MQHSDNRMETPAHTTLTHFSEIPFVNPGLHGSTLKISLKSCISLDGSRYFITLLIHVDCHFNTSNFKHVTRKDPLKYSLHCSL